MMGFYLSLTWAKLTYKASQGVLEKKPQLMTFYYLSSMTIYIVIIFLILCFNTMAYTMRIFELTGIQPLISVLKL